MTVVGFHNSHEQIHPSVLLDAVQKAEQAGFTAAMCSDHITPWGERQGHSAFAWSWLGAALQATSLPFGAVNAPGQRYHPAIIAQAVATLAAMYPGRFWVALGSGQAMNEHVTGEPWPRKDVRNARLRECVDVIRALHAGEEVSHDGLVTVDRARIFTLPDEPPRLIGAAISVETAGLVAEWADGLITVNQDHDHLRRMIETYRGGGGRGRLRLQVHLSWGRDEESALRTAMEQWAGNVVGPPLAWDLPTVEHFDAVAPHISADTVRTGVIVASDAAKLTAQLHEFVDLGFDELYLHHVGQTQDEWLDVAADQVLPQLGVTAP